MNNSKLVTMTNAEYHALQAIGHSSIVKAMRSPAHLREALDNPKQPTPAMELGTAIHTAILEPKIFREEYAVVDDVLLTGTLSSLDDYKIAAGELNVKFDALNKDELKAAIKAADKDSKFKFYEEEFHGFIQEKFFSNLNSLRQLSRCVLL